MHETNSKQVGMIQQARQQVGLLTFAGQVLAYPVDVWTRKPGTCGARYFANTGGYLAAVVPWAWLGLAGGEPAPLLAGLAALYPAGAAWHWYWRARYERRGWYTHSAYVGDRRLGRFETAVLLLAGGLGMIGSVPFGTYVLAAAIGSALNDDICRWRERAIATALRDARIEQEVYRARQDR